MHSNGLEGTEDDQTGHRSITGGAGTYMGASGQIAQIITGVNTSLFADGSGMNAPNFRFEFDILLPNI